MVGEETSWSWSLYEVLTRAFSEEDLVTYSLPLLLSVEIEKPLSTVYLYMLTAKEHESTKRLWWRYKLVNAVQRIGQG